MEIRDWKRETEKKIAESFYSTEARVIFCKLATINHSFLNLNTTGQIFAFELLEEGERKKKLQNIANACKLLEIDIPKLDSGSIIPVNLRGFF